MDSSGLRGIADPRRRLAAYAAAWAVFLLASPLVRFVGADAGDWWGIFGVLAVAVPLTWEPQIANAVLADAHPELHAKWGWRSRWRLYTTRWLKIQWYLLGPAASEDDPRLRGASLDFRIAVAMLPVVFVVAYLVLR